MINQDIDVEALKNDKEFLKSLEKLESDMRESNSILKGYELLNAKFFLKRDEGGPLRWKFFLLLVEEEAFG